MSATIADVRARARHLFRTDQSASAFLNLPCAALRGVPAELAVHGRVDEVIAYLVRLECEAPPETLEDRLPGSRGT
jgi:hypothetical protein